MFESAINPFIKRPVVLYVCIIIHQSTQERKTTGKSFSASQTTFGTVRTYLGTNLLFII